MEFLDLKTQNIVSNALQRLNNFTGITFLSPGSKARMLVDILSEELGLQAEQFDQNIGAGLLRKASGVMLDYLGEIYGLSRLEEVRSDVNSAEQNFVLYTVGANFGEVNNGSDIIIEAGKMRISNSENFDSDAIVYINSNDIVLSSNENRVFFSAQSESSGANANIGSEALVHHDFINYADSIGRSLLVKNNHSITYGRDRENDDNYRYRIQKEKISSEAGNETAIRLALLIIPGVADVVQIPYARGIGTCDWLISSTSVSVSQELLNICQEVISRRQSVGMANSAKSPVLIGTEFSFSLTYKSRLEDRQKEKIKTDIRKNISEYINNLTIGQTLILDQVVRIILSSSDQIASMGDDNTAENFKNIFIYKRSELSNALTRKSLTANYTAKNYERVVLETSIATPITIIDNN
jgi:uncharacterized phage protein gp47/JayE